MKFSFPYKIHDTIPIYKDWENEKDLLGTARLIKYHRPGRTFILEEMLPESSQIVYNYQEWLVDNTSWEHYAPRAVKIRYIDTIGLSSSSEKVVEEASDDEPINYDSPFLEDLVDTKSNTDDKADSEV